MDEEKGQSESPLRKVRQPSVPGVAGEPYPHSPPF